MARPEIPEWTAARPVLGSRFACSTPARKNCCCDIRKKSRSSTRARSSRKIYEEEYGVFGGAPFWSTGGRLRFRQASGRYGPAGRYLAHRRTGACTLRQRRIVRPVQSGKLYATGCSRDLAKIFDSTEYAKWKSFRQSEDSRYVALALPRTLGRLPYGAETKPIDESSGMKST